LIARTYNNLNHSSDHIYATLMIFISLTTKYKFAALLETIEYLVY
jgi:hypothetical protein